jgi:hypothetical protein
LDQLTSCSNGPDKIRPDGSLMPQLLICYYIPASGDKPVASCSDVCDGLAFIHWSFWVEMNKGQFPRLADLCNRMIAELPFEPIEDELRLLLTYSLMPTMLKLVTKGILFGLIARPDGTTAIVITDGKGGDAG